MMVIMHPYETIKHWMTTPLSFPVPQVAGREIPHGDSRCQRPSSDLKPTFQLGTQTTFELVRSNHPESHRGGGAVVPQATSDSHGKPWSSQEGNIGKP